MRFISALAFLMLTTGAFARPLLPSQKLSDLNQLVGTIKSGYGPLKYKEKVLGLNIDMLAREYAEKIEATKTNGEFYYLLVQFVAEFQDSHFGASLPTTHISKLHFTTDYVDGKVLIESVNRDKLSEEKFPFEKGDEVVTFNGQPVQEEINKLVPYMGQGFKLTAQRKATMMLMKRPGGKVPVQTGIVTLGIKRFKTRMISEVALTWELSGKPVDEFKASNKSNFVSHNVNFDQIKLPKDQVENTYRCSGTTRVKIPEDAKVIMKEPFVAYYHLTTKGNIGYLRIPHYSPEDKNYELRFKQYEYAVSVLEKNTVGLIIDQDHNCGGSVSYLHQIVSLFAKEEFVPMQFELLANKEAFMDFSKWTTETNPMTIESKDIERVRDLIYDTWMNGENFLTVKTSIFGNLVEAKNKVAYTKPILMLVDEMCGSGGDAFPSIMQGIGRAKLLGTRTMGAGGHVVELPPLNNSQILVRMTKSLFYRPDGVAVENNGATPDISYFPTQNDFVNEYQDYQKFYLNELFKML